MGNELSMAIFHSYCYNTRGSMSHFYTFNGDPRHRSPIASAPQAQHGGFFVAKLRKTKTPFGEDLMRINPWFLAGVIHQPILWGSDGMPCFMENPFNRSPKLVEKQVLYLGMPKWSSVQTPEPWNDKRFWTLLDACP